MSENTVNVKVKRGTWSRIAKRYKVSEAHISMIRKGQRVGRPAIMRAIEKAQAQAAA